MDEMNNKETVFCDTYQSPLGKIFMESDGKSLVSLGFFAKNGEFSNNLPVFEETKRWLDVYFASYVPDFTPQINFTKCGKKVSQFRLAVWQNLLSIPYGTTTTYGEIAHKLAETLGVPQMSAQAVGGAVGANPIAIIVPCHRVIGANGKLTGYRYGLNIKQKLLELEGNCKKIWRKIENEYR